jgi:hypothetical protein
MSNLPIDLTDTLVFDQSKLQDFVDCPSRFYLRYVRGLRYPAPQSEPLRDFEEFVERGSQFHRLVHQHGIGIPVRALEATIADEKVAAWWKAYKTFGLADLPPARRWEITLSAPLAGQRLVAKYDLLALAPDRAVILDWKTAQRRPTRDSLQRRLQTIVYPYLLARAGAHLNGGQPIAPDSISLIYWFAEFPKQPEIFAYSAEQFERDGAYLNSVLTDILSRRDEAAFELTDDLERCRFCSFRSLHDRGTHAGDFEALDADEADDLAIDLDFDQIAELEF